MKVCAEQTNKHEIFAMCDLIDLFFCKARILFFLVYILSCTRFLGYQLLDPVTGYVLPPAINEGPQKGTVNFKRETKPGSFRRKPQIIYGTPSCLLYTSDAADE